MTQYRHEENNGVVFSFLDINHTPVNEFSNCYNEQKCPTIPFSSAQDFLLRKLQTKTQGEMLSQQQHAT